MTIRKIEEMTWKEFEELDKEKSVVLIALSPIEEHGPHLPLGTDFIGANDCLLSTVSYLERIDSSFNYIIHPPLPIGYNENIMNFPGTIFYRSKTIENIIIDLGESIARSGINKIVIINHHLDLGHINAIEKARQYLSEKFKVKLIETAGHLIYSEQNQFKNENEEIQNEVHADIRETSYMLYRHPELLRECYKNLQPVYLDMRKFMMSGEKYFEECGIVDGYIGSPGKASIEYGERMYDEMIKTTSDLILKFLKDGFIPEFAFRIKYIMDKIDWR